MKLEIEINDKLFSIAEKYKLEKGLIFDKIIYLKLIKSSYEVFVDICLLHLLEMMINDGLITMYQDKYIATALGDQLLKDIELVSKGKYIPIDNTEELITDNFIDEYLKCFKDHTGKFIKKKNGQTLGSNCKVIKKKFIDFFKTYINDLQRLTAEREIKKPIEEIIVDATKEYVESHEHNDYQYCRRADYFISKQDKNKIKTSDLLVAFETYIENIPDDNQISFNFFDNLSL
jgi:hypothetical protein